MEIASLGAWASVVSHWFGPRRGATQARLAANRYVATWKVRAAAEKKAAEEAARDKTRDEAIALKRSIPQPKEWWEEDWDKCARAPPRIDTPQQAATLGHAHAGLEMRSTLQGTPHRSAFPATRTQQWLMRGQAS